MDSKNRISQDLLDKLNEHHDLIKELYQTKNYSSEKIANIIGVSKATIDRYRKAYKIDRLFTDKNWFESKVNEGLSQVGIAKLCGCSTRPIMKYGILHGLYEKKKKRQLIVKENYFNSYNKKSCYWAGFINADGHLANENRYGTNSKQSFLSINLSAKDISHLKKLNKELTRENIIREYNTGEYKMCQLKISRKNICSDLNNKFDIAYNNKSLQETISSKIPNEYLKDFVRGHFDGDGSISISNGGVFVSIVGGKDFCYKIKDIIDKEYNKDIGKIVADNRNNDMFYYKITNMKDAILLYLYMYYKDCVHLERKRDIFRKILYKI